MGDIAMDIIGKRFGKLTVIKRIENYITKKGKKRSQWKCLCDCGKYCTKVGHDIKRTNSCGCHHKEVLWTGGGIISGTYWGSLKKCARTRGIVFNITLEYAEKLLQTQKFRCALSGLPIITHLLKNEQRNNTASIDRINPDLGYVEGNIQWVHKDINCMKNDFQENEFFAYINAIMATHGKDGVIEIKG